MEYHCDNWMCEKFHTNPIEYMNVKVKVIEGEIQYFDKYNKRIVCPDCEQPMAEVPKDFQGFGLFLGSFDSKSPQEKREILKKREREYDKKDKVTKEYRKFKNNGGID